MATLPDGTTVTERTVEGWNASPPPLAALSASLESRNIPKGESTDISGSLSLSGSIATSEPVSFSITGPSSPSVSDATTDSNGRYSKTIGPFSVNGSYELSAVVDGFGEKTIEGWNQ